MSNIYSKLGSIFYVLWGALHIVVAGKVYSLAQGMGADVVQGRIFQDAWSLLFFAVFAIIVGLILNWKNDRLGYWLNLIVVSVADIGYILFILVPGYVPIVPGVIGPALWLLAVVFSTMGIRTMGARKAAIKKTSINNNTCSRRKPGGIKNERRSSGSKKRALRR